MALNNDNNDKSCKCTTPEYELILNEQGPQGRQGEKGDAGFTPIISVKDNTPSNYTLNILTQDGQITTPNLKANLPAGGATGQVLTKNSANQDDCSWQNLPASTIETEGIARLATEADFKTTKDTEASDNTIVTPALFNTELTKQSKKFVTTNTVQTIEADKTIFSNLKLPYNSTSQKGSIITNASVEEVNIPIIEPYDNNGSFRIGAVKEEASINIQNGFDINNNIIDELQGVTYYEQGQKGKIVADFNLYKYVKAGNNITIDKTSTGITINSTGGGITKIPQANATTQGNTFNGASQLVQLDSSGKLPAIDGSQLTNLQVSPAPTNMVTTDTVQNITGQKVFKNTFVSSDGTATTGNRVLIYNSKIDLISNTGVAASIDTEGINLRGGINSSGLSLQSSYNLVSFGQNNTQMRIYASQLERYSDCNDNGAIILDAKNFSTVAPTGNLKYWTGTEEAYTGLATKDADTLYRTTDTNKVYLGTIQIGGQ